MKQRAASAEVGGVDARSLELASVGALTFSPGSVLFLADNLQAKIFAIDLSGDDQATRVEEIENFEERLAAFLGCGTDHVTIEDLEVHPLSQALYLSVMRRAGVGVVPMVVRIGNGGEISVVELNDLDFTWIAIHDAPAADDEREDSRAVADGDADGDPLELPQLGLTVWVARDALRTTTVTDLAYTDGELLVAGASNEEFVSTFRRIPFPFGGEAQSTQLEIFHVAHGKYETHSPIRTFIPYGDGTSVLASYTCTPLVQFSLADLIGGTRTVGRTVADLGMLSTPVDMVSFTHAAQDYVLVSNSRRPLMKIACRDIDRQDPLTEPKEPLGVPREELPHEGVGRMAAADGRVLMLQRTDAGQHLRSYDNASL
jgi:hypothetical protein